MRVSLLISAAALACLNGCAPSGYMYDQWSFTPRKIDNLQPTAHATQSGPLVQLHTPDEAKRYAACVKYYEFAEEIAGFKQNGLSEDYVSDWAASQAYGPQGQAFRGSQDIEQMLRSLAHAAYSDPSKYGNDSSKFGRYAFDSCIKGSML